MQLALIALATGLAGFAWSASAAEPQPLTVSWRDKPPYHYFENGKEKGFLLERARRVFALAKVPVRFVQEPTKRVWANFDNGVENYCALGWYHLPERVRVAQYTVPFYQDPPQVVAVAPAYVKAVRAHSTFADLLTDPNLTIGMVDGASYGAQVDAMLEAGRNKVLRRTVGPTAILNMIAPGRASFTLVDRPDWDWNHQHEPELRDAVAVEFPDMPPGLARYIVCSKDVPQATMVRINRAIDTVTSEDRTQRSGTR